MIYLFVANSYEARPFIQYCQMVRDESEEKFEVYIGKNIMLVVTRPGPIAAAITTAYFLGGRRPATYDIVVNVGLCNSLNEDIPIGTMYLIYKMNEAFTGRKLFPDLLCAHNFSEGALTSVGSFTEILEQRDKMETHLVDLEAASIFQSALAICHTHYIYFFKIVAGYGSRQKLLPKVGMTLVAAHVEAIMEWLWEIQSKFPIEYTFSKEEVKKLKYLSKMMCLSPYHEQEFFRYAYFYKSEQKDLMEALSQYISEIERADILLRVEGKVYYDALLKKLVV